MDLIEQLNGLIAQYVADVDELMRKRKPGDGILGMPGGPKDDPCHMAFDQQVEALAGQLAALPPDAALAEQAVLLLLNSEGQGHGVQCAQLMLTAVQRHALPLIPYLAPADARRLLDAYVKRYPPLRRFPAQNQIVKALKVQTK